MKLFFRGRRAVFFSIACAAAVNLGNGRGVALSVAAATWFRVSVGAAAFAALAPHRAAQ